LTIGKGDRICIVSRSFGQVKVILSVKLSEVDLGVLVFSKFRLENGVSFGASNHGGMVYDTNFLNAFQIKWLSLNAVSSAIMCSAIHIIRCVSKRPLEGASQLLLTTNTIGGLCLIRVLEMLEGVLCSQQA
jgi:hypothetical protein